MQKIRKFTLTLMAVILCVTSLSVNALAEEDDETVIEPESTLYSATYEFVLDDESEELPEQVMALLPPDRADISPGDIITNEDLEDVALDEATYEFVGWNHEEYEITDSDVHFKGTWHKSVNDSGLDGGVGQEEPEANGNDESYNVTFRFVEQEALNGIGNLPDEVMALLPEDQEVEAG